jgi:RNA polymerase sigma-70 factor (ECF subfamily)
MKELETQTARSESAAADFEALFQTHWPGIYALVYRLVGDPAEAEDLALETFLRLFQRPPRDQTNLAGWLYRVATRLGLNALRARRRRVQYETQAGQDRLADSATTSPATLVEQAEERRRVRQVLARMKKRSAQILMLRYSGMTYAQVAAALGLNPNSVGTLLARAEREFERRYSG